MSTPPDDQRDTLLSSGQSRALGERIQGYMTGLDDALTVASAMEGSTAFARNQIHRANDGGSQTVQFGEHFAQRDTSLTTNQLDEASLRSAVAKAEALAKGLRIAGVDTPLEPLRPPGQVNHALWAESSLTLVTPEGRLAAIDGSLSACRDAGLNAAGVIATYPGTKAVLNRAGHYEYGRRSTCRYSLTVRTPDGTGSGWAGWEGEDWSACDVSAITARAIELAQRSKNPVAVEPGRWTVVMTPEATGTLVAQITRAFHGQILDGPSSDGGGAPFSGDGGGNKIGLPVLDARVSLSADPMDPDGGFVPFDYFGGIVQYRPVVWVDHGILKTLSYPTAASAAAHGLEPVTNPGVLRMAGGPASIEEMIASTPRGIFITRFSDVMAVTLKHLLLTGVTRDGTFLIEQGKITKPVKNMRFEDSPFFFLNNLESIGPARRVEAGHVMPAIKVKDFAFTSLTDAV